MSEKSAYHTMVDALTLQGVPRDRAELRARELCRDAPPPTTKDPSIAEKVEQKKVMEVLIERGFKVRSTSQSRPSKVAIGLPDLFVTHKTRAIGFWFETKRQVGGVVSDAQAEFAADCRRAGIDWFTGDRFDAQRIADDLIARDDRWNARCRRHPVPGNPHSLDAEAFGRAEVRLCLWCGLLESEWPTLAFNHE